MTETDLLLHLWAKKRTDPPSEVRYPLLFHMVDVAMVTQALWKNSLHSGTRSFIARQLGLPEAAASVWISFLTGLHDIGKASPVFQSKSEEARSVLADAGFVFERHVVDYPHGEITAWVLPELIEGYLPEASSHEQLSRVISIAIGGHHGTFCRSLSGPGPRQKGGDKWNRIRFNLVVELARLFNIASLPTPSCEKDNSFLVVLSGLTSVADWIGSNEDYFPYDNGFRSPDDHLEVSRCRAEKAMAHLGWTGWHPPAVISDFEQLFPFIAHPRPLQKKIAELAESLGNSPSLIIIEAPMGEGKTEAAMYLADRWMVALGQKGCYFALPTQATSNQMFRRISEFLETRYPDLVTNLQLVHAGAILSTDFYDMRMRVSQDDDSIGPSSDVSALDIAWFLPKKRALLAPFGVGTVDQSLLSVLQTRHYFVRLFGLAQKTVIVDEIHAYDTYMSTLLERLISWLRGLGSPIILLSATLPEKKREDLVIAYGGDTKALMKGTYPRVTCVSGQVTQVHKFNATRHVELQVRQISDDLDTLVAQLGKTIEKGGCIAVVCNTVKRAQQTYSTIKQAGFLPPNELMLLHSRYTFDERETRERNVLDAFGKEGNRPKRAILVATQIIEQSLDVDFDLMVTDLAPADLVIQRAGRVHRHDNLRPPSFTEPALWIRMPDADDNGIPEFGASASVYESYFLLLSYLELRSCSTISLPDEIQTIVENVYGEPECAWPSPAFQKAVEEAKANMDRGMQEDREQALVNVVAKHDAKDPIDFFCYQFNRELEEDNPTVHRSLQALTRLVEPSVQVVCLHESPDGTFLHDCNHAKLDMNEVPCGNEVHDLLRRSMTITDRRVVFMLIDQEPPAAWKKCPALRHHRLLEFEDGVAMVGKYTLRLDEELGLCIEY